MAEERTPEDGPDWTAPPQDLLTNAVSALVTGALIPALGPVAPLAGVVAGSAANAFCQLTRWAVVSRSEARRELFEAELQASFENLPDDKLKDPAQQEVIFQNYRRAMEAIDPVAMRPLARLTRLYVDRPLDPFFRAVGRLLVDLGADEMEALCDLLVSCRRKGTPDVRIVSWRNGDCWELRLSGAPPGQATDTSDPLVVPRHPRTPQVLDLLGRVGLLVDPGHDRHGTDLLMVGAIQIRQETVEHLLEVLGPTWPS